MMGDVEFPYALDYVDKNGNAYNKDDSFYISMEDGRSAKVNYFCFNYAGCK